MRVRHSRGPADRFEEAFDIVDSGECGKAIPDWSWPGPGPRPGRRSDRGAREATDRQRDHERQRPTHQDPHRGTPLRSASESCAEGAERDEADERDDDAEHIAAASDVLGVAAAVLSGYQIAGDDLVDAIRCLRAALHGYVALEAASGTKMPRDNTLSYHRMIAGLDLVFDAWPSTLDPAASRTPTARRASTR